MSTILAAAPCLLITAYTFGERSKNAVIGFPCRVARSPAVGI